MQWHEDGRKVLAGAIVFAVVVFAWMFKYEVFGQLGAMHKNRFTGAVCPVRESCWFTSRGLFDPD